jgi:hypothetical protein
VGVLSAHSICSFSEDVKIICSHAAPAAQTRGSDRMTNPMTSTDGMIFEFKEMEQAKAFAATVKERFQLDGRVFDNVEEAYRAHTYPFVQKPPVAHIDRPNWFLPDDASKKQRDQAFKIELQIEKLAREFGGKFIGI